jgi:hypothetical protein
MIVPPGIPSEFTELYTLENLCTAFVSGHRSSDAASVLVSYQGIASAMPPVIRNQTPL